MHRRAKARDLFEMGQAMALAMNEPDRLKEILTPSNSFDPEKIPHMLRIPKKKT